MSGPITLRAGAVIQPPFVSLLSSLSAPTAGSGSGSASVGTDWALGAGGHGVAAGAGNATLVCSGSTCSGSLVSGLLLEILVELIATSTSRAIGNASINVNRVYAPTASDGFMHTLDEALTDFAAGEFDILVAPTPLNYARLATDPALQTLVVTPSVSYFSTPILPLTQSVGLPNDPWAFLRPFSTNVWLLVASITIVASLGLWLLDAASPYGTARAKAEKPDRRAWDCTRSCAYGLWNALGRGGEAPDPWSTRAVAASFFAFFLFIQSAYDSALNSQSIENRLATGIASYLDLNRYRLPFAAANNSAEISMMQSSRYYTTRAMAARAVSYSTYAAAAGAVASGQQVAAIGGKYMLHAGAVAAGACDVQFIGTPVDHIYFTFLMNTQTLGTRIVQPINEGLSNLMDNGRISQLAAAYLTAGTPSPTDATRCSAQIVENTRKFAVGENVGAATLRNLAGVFYIFIALLALAWMMLLLERTIFRKDLRGVSAAVRWINHLLGHRSADSDPCLPCLRAKPRTAPGDRTPSTARLRSVVFTNPLANHDALRPAAGIAPQSGPTTALSSSPRAAGVVNDSGAASPQQGDPMVPASSPPTAAVGDNMAAASAPQYDPAAVPAPSPTAAAVVGSAGAASAPQTCGPGAVRASPLSAPSFSHDAAAIGSRGAAEAPWVSAPVPDGGAVTKVAASRARTRVAAAAAPVADRLAVHHTPGPQDVADSSALASDWK